MKAASAGLIAHAAEPVHTWGWAAKFTRRDGAVLRFTGGNAQVELDGEDYLPAPGFTVANLTTTLGYSVDTSRLMTLATDDITRLQFLVGLWRGARVELMRYNFMAPADGVIRWPVYRVGKSKPVVGGFEIELRDLRTLLQQDQTRYTGPGCGYRLGSALCGVDLGPITYPFEVTAVASRQTFTIDLTDPGDYPADWFTAGELYWDAPSPYNGVSDPQWVLEHEAAGVVTLAVGLVADISVGWTGTIVAGCLKRRDEDCRDKHGNVLNFGGQKGVSPQDVAGAPA